MVLASLRQRVGIALRRYSSWASSNFRQEVYGLVSFSGVVLELRHECSTSDSYPALLWVGVLFVLVDAMFLYRQFLAGTLLRRFSFLRFTASDQPDWLDDVVADLPQVLWLALYTILYKCSVLSVVTSIDACLKIFQDLGSRPETKEFQRSLLGGGHSADSAGRTEPLPMEQRKLLSPQGPDNQV